MERRLRIGLLFGGRSAEHDVSVLSAGNVFRALDPARYDVVPIGITRAGAWVLCPPAGDTFPTAVPDDGPRVALLPGGEGRLVVLGEGGGAGEAADRLDVLFPVLHGPFGEDGTVQGAAELAGVPFVGSGVLGSAAAMDKDVTKRLLRDAGLPGPRFLALRRGEAPSFAEVTAALGCPVFVKPARLGSSVGVGKAETAEAFAAAVAEAFRHDSKILVEECIRGREIECGVLEAEDGTLLVSPAGEVAPSSHHAFYSYEAKYLDEDGAAIRVPADLPAGVADAVRRLAEAAFRTLGCEGLARVDVFLRADGSVLINEVNTLPGFTRISMYPKVLAAAGVPYPELVDRLIRHALARAAAEPAGA